MGILEDRKKKIPVFIWYIIVLVFVVVIMLVVRPMLAASQVEDISYDKFIALLGNDEVKEVTIMKTSTDPYLQVTPKDTSKKVIYKVIYIPDDDKLIERLESSGVTFKQKNETVSIFRNIFSTFIVLLLTWGVMFLLFRLLSKRMSGGVMSFGKSTGKIYAEMSTGKTFDDVAGQDEAKQSLVEIIDFLNNPNKYTEIGARLPKGALLVGPPGTGKTLLAKAVAGEAKVPFFSLSGSEFVEMFVGVGASRVRDLFKQAVENAPCIVFIDEIDTIGKSRDNVLGGNDEREQTLNQLLAEMDGFDSSKGVVILAATNRPEVLDKALLRPGRFDRRIIVNLPDVEGRTAILKVHAKNKKMADDVDLAAIARATPGASGADLENIINEAALRAVRGKETRVSQKYLEEAIEVVLAGEQKKSTVLSEEEKKIVAYHEVGHALVAAKLTNEAPVQKITIIPRTSGALGFTMQVDKEEKHLYSKKELLNQITVLAGGRAAEELKFDSITTGASNDIERATALARDMITVYGMSDKFGFLHLEGKTNIFLTNSNQGNYSDTTASEIDREIMSVVNTCYDNAVSVLRENISVLDELAGVLFVKENITGAEFMELYTNATNKAKAASEEAVSDNGEAPILPPTETPDITGANGSLT